MSDNPWINLLEVAAAALDPLGNPNDYRGEMIDAIKAIDPHWRPSLRPQALIMAPRKPPPPGQHFRKEPDASDE